MQPVNPSHWPKPKGYNNGMMSADGLLFVAGQIGQNDDGKLPEAFVEQVSQALRNVLTVIESAGGTAECISRMTWYVSDIQAYRDHQEEIGVAYRDIMGRHFPAMSLIAVTALVEKTAQVEIEATARVPTPEARAR